MMKVKAKMRKCISSILVLLAVSSALVGCGPAGRTPAAGPAAGEEATPAATATPTPLPGLASLPSYAVDFSIVSETTVDGQTTRSTYQLEVQRVRDPFIQRVVIQPAEEQEPVTLIQTRQHSYLIPAEGPCEYTVAGDSDPVPPEFFRPEELIGADSGAERVEPDEMVNGVLARHYVIGDQGSPDTQTRSEGEVWVATEGDYVVRYALRTDTDDPATGETGRIELTYEIKDIGVSFDIEEPANCMATDRELPGVPSPAG